MKIRRLLIALFAVVFSFSLLACGGKEETPSNNNTNPDGNGGNPTEDDGPLLPDLSNFVAPAEPLQICVGSESVEFYYDALNSFINDNNIVDKNGNKIQVNVIGVDTGSYANTFLRDPSVGADIFVTAHDNLGKLLDGQGAIAPITNEKLVNQIVSTTEEDFLNVCYLSQGGATPEFYGVPIIRQALVLYYNKTYFADDAAVSSWEKILEVAANTGKMATAYMGTDGYSYSHWLLAQPANDTAKKAFGEKGSLQLFQKGSAAYNKAWGDDQVAIHKYAQRFTLNANGRNGAVTADSWVSELQKDSVLTVVGGSWSLNSITGVLGDNYGVTTLPTFKLTAADAYGKAMAGMEFQSGSFYDVKCLIKKKDSAYEPLLDAILYFLSSKEVQEGSYKECGNLPASTQVEINATDALAQAQVKQGQSAGIPQPFGYNPEFNPMYYSKGTDAIFLEIHQNTKNAYASKDAIKLALQKISYIWANGVVPGSDQEVKDWANAYTA